MVANWKQAGVELDRIKCEELQAMDEEASAEIFNRLGMGWVDDWQNPEWPPGQGLVLQQSISPRRMAKRRSRGNW